MVIAVVLATWLVVVLVFFFVAPSWLRRKPCARGSGSHGAGFMGIGNELFHPEAHEAMQVRDEQSRLVAPAPSPDGDMGISAGSIRITVPDRSDEDRR